MIYSIGKIIKRILLSFILFIFYKLAIGQDSNSLNIPEFFRSSYPNSTVFKLEFGDFTNDTITNYYLKNDYIIYFETEKYLLYFVFQLDDNKYSVCHLVNKYSKEVVQFFPQMYIMAQYTPQMYFLNTQYITVYNKVDPYSYSFDRYLLHYKFGQVVDFDSKIKYKVEVPDIQRKYLVIKEISDFEFDMVFEEANRITTKMKDDVEQKCYIRLHYINEIDLKRENFIIWKKGKISK